MSQPTVTGHKLVFWDVEAGEGDVGAEKRAHIAKAALALLVQGDVTFACSAGGYDKSEPLELAVLIPAEEDPHKLLPAIQRALKAEGTALSGKVNIKMDHEHFEFAEHELASIKAAAHISDHKAAREHMDRLAALPHTPVDVPKDHLEHLMNHIKTVQKQRDGETAKGSGTAAPTPAIGGVAAPTVADGVAALVAADATLAQNWPPNVVLESFTISAEKYERMKKARGKDIKAEIEALQNALASLSKEKNTNTATLTMIGSGIVTVGKVMYKAYDALKDVGSLAQCISSTMSAAGGIAGVAAIAAAVAVAIAALFILFKQALNDLVVVNGSSTEITLDSDHILHGTCNNVTTTIPAAPNPLTLGSKPMVYPCGFFIYSKYTILKTSVGFYGSTVGLAFKRMADNKFFSVGLDCPNTIFGTNGVQIRGDNNAAEVANAVNKKSKDTDSIKIGTDTVTVSRAAGLGSTNYAICWTGK